MLEAVQQNMFVCVLGFASLIVVLAALIVVALNSVRNKMIAQEVRNERAFCREWDELSGEVRILADSKTHVPPIRVGRYAGYVGNRPRRFVRRR